MAESMQEEWDPSRFDDEVKFVEHVLKSWKEDCYSEQSAPLKDSKLGITTFTVMLEVGETMRGVPKSFAVKTFVEKAGCLLDKAEKRLPTCDSDPKKWVTEFVRSEEYRNVLKLNETTAEEFIKKCQDMNPKAAVEAVCGKIKTARHDYIKEATEIQFCYSIFSFGLMFFKCCETYGELRKMDINCKGLLNNIETRLEEEERKLKEINLNEPRDIIKIKMMLENLKDIRLKFELIKKDLELYKKDTTSRRNEHGTGVFTGFVNVLRAAVDYSTAATAGAGKGLAMAAGVMFGFSTVGHFGAGLLCQAQLDKLEEQLVKMEEYEERAKKVVRRVESLIRQMQRMHSTPVAQANISAAAIPSPVA